MPRPLFIIEGDTYLIYANTQGYRAIEEARWLELENGMIRLKSRSASDKLMRLLLSLASGFSVERHCLYLFDQERNEAELWLRRLARSSDTPRRFLFSLIEHEVSSHGHYMADVPLSPRQRELAHYLLSGASLDESAAKMGISRRTAKDHLSALFKHSMTNRQSDLVAWLTRYRFS